MKKLLTQIVVVTLALGMTVSTFAQSPNNATRLRRTGNEGAQQGGSVAQPADATTDKVPADKTPAGKAETDKSVTDKPVADKPATDKAATDKSAADKPVNEKAGTDKAVTASTGNAGKEKNKGLAEVTADGTTNRMDDKSEEEAIVPYYNNFFTSYRLGPEDVISVNVFNQDRYSKPNIKIPPSGRIYLPLISEGLFVNGKTVDQVSEMVKKRYDEYIIDPQVSVSLDQAGSYRYSVVGDVATPGIRLMTRRLSVSEAISEAGGVLQTGNRSRIVVLRKQTDGTLKPIPVNLTAVYKGEAPDSVYLLPGDQVIVPGNKLKKLQTILGFAQVMTFANMFRGGW